MATKMLPKPFLEPRWFQKTGVDLGRKIPGELQSLQQTVSPCQELEGWKLVVGDVVKSLVQVGKSQVLLVKLHY